MQRGELWWARLEEDEPVVLLSGGSAAELRAMRIVSPATEAQKRGFVVLSGEEACEAGSVPGGVGIEVHIGRPEGLPYEGVVRVAVAGDGRIYCTWLLTLTPEYLVRRIGALSPAKLRQLDNALRLAAIE